jgi:hypothetical protein
VTKPVQVDVSSVEMEENMAVISLLQHPPETTDILKMKVVRYTETSEQFITLRCKNPKDDH